MLTHRLLRSVVSHLWEPALPSVWHHYEAHGTPCHTFQREKDFISWSRKRAEAQKKTSHHTWPYENIETSRQKWQTTSAQWPGHFCRKMSRSNTCRKLRKCAENPSGPKYIRIRTSFIFRTQCDFLLTIEVSTFSDQVSAIEARDAAIFTRIKSFSEMTKNGLLDHG